MQRFNLFALKFFFIATLFLLTSCSFSKNKASTNSPYFEEIFHQILKPNFQVNPPIENLLTLTNISCNLDLLSVIDCTQKNWLRKSGEERAQMSESHFDIYPEIISELQNLGLINEVMPANNDFEYIFWLGAMYKTVHHRLAYLANQFGRGIFAKNLVIMGSHRPLDLENELTPLILDYAPKQLPTTEVEMMKFLIELPRFKEIFGHLRLIIVASSMKHRGTKFVRANTKDTFIDFNKLGMMPGKSLVISNQPFVARQGLIAKAALGEQFFCETIGPSADQKFISDIYLDELARLLYEIQKEKSIVHSFWGHD